MRCLIERDAARATLEAADPRAYVSALLDDGDADIAWAAAHEAPEMIGRDLWLRLAQRRQPSHPGEALATYHRVVDEILVETDRRAYQHAVRVLKQSRVAAAAAQQTDVFAANLTRLRDVHRRRPTFIATLDQAELSDG